MIDQIERCNHESTTSMFVVFCCGRASACIQQTRHTKDACAGFFLLSFVVISCILWLILAVHGTLCYFSTLKCCCVHIVFLNTEHMGMYLLSSLQLDILLLAQNVVSWQSWCIVGSHVCHIVSSVFLLLFLVYRESLKNYVADHIWIWGLAL